MRPAAAPALALALSLAPALGAGGCSPRDEPGVVVVATPWPAATRAEVGRLALAGTAIRWVELGPHRWADACDRRGGVDLVLGGSPRQVLARADAGRLDPIDADDPAPWREVGRPPAGAATAPAPPGEADPRVDPAALDRARAALDGSGWAAGYADLVRRPVASWRAAGSMPGPGGSGRAVVALARGGRHRAAALDLLAALGGPLAIAPAPPDAEVAARADDLLADLLGAALVDARNERRDAQAALAAPDHPADVDALVGATPPWPPASVVRLRDDPTRASLADVLAGQMVGDPEALDWLEHSWRQPRRRVDPALLRDLAGAADGRLAREPRFRAWLRGEWAAWSRQQNRRVARLAGGYRPR